MTEKEVNAYAKGFKVGWDKAVGLIKQRLMEDDINNSRVRFAWDKVEEYLEHDEIKEVRDTKKRSKGR